MGNIEVIQPTTRRKLIFDSKKQDVHSYSKSPRQMTPEHSNTHRYSKTNRNYKIRDINDEVETRRQKRESGAVSDRKKPSWMMNREKEEEIGEKSDRNTNKVQEAVASSRVTNFNNFLIQIKKQMQQNANNSSMQYRNLIQLSKPQQKNRQNGQQLVFNLRLENQKLQLQKYKKLMVRQLSKSHLISDVCLQNNNQNQKILTIKYEQNRTMNLMGDRGDKKAERVNLGSFREQNQIQLGNKVVQETNKYANAFDKAHQIMQQMKRRTKCLEELIQSKSHFYNQDVQIKNLTNKKCQGQTTQTKKQNIQMPKLQINKQKQSQKNIQTQKILFQQQKETHNEPSQVRIQKICGLFKQINKIQLNQSELQRQIKEAIADRDDSESECSGTFSRIEAH